ncbi:Short-chain dehydrogenase [Pilibacter termitis]|uniref:Short-chain dehydrogenase n=1 Tax=Pilibacter termitis TaxID=263852 RepID=A0A1T4NM19_9ENTE|nr:SDR family NAD(P)-dependent oxidoreductase [Pilibacter termitis]SJZ80145.1 Short-chain dehydrogenase [Pilibacter termitis]
MSEKKVVIITGASSGMGFAAAKLFAQNGWIVYAGARRVERMKELEQFGVYICPLDVTSELSVQSFIEKVQTEQMRIDVLVNNAGYGEYGPVEEIPLENAKYQFDVNLFGVARMTNAVLPTMKKQKSGRIIHISSIGADVYTPLGAWYHATKAALSMYSNVLDTEITPLGIRSIAIQPGVTQSEWSEIAMKNAEKNLKENSSYQDLVIGVKGLMSTVETGATSEKLAQLFYKAATTSKPKSRYFYSFSDRIMVAIERIFPRLYRFSLEKIIQRAKKSK